MGGSTLPAGPCSASTATRGGFGDHDGERVPALLGPAFAGPVRPQARTPSEASGLTGSPHQQWKWPAFRAGLGASCVAQQLQPVTESKRLSTTDAISTGLLGGGNRSMGMCDNVRANPSGDSTFLFLSQPKYG